MRFIVFGVFKQDFVHVGAGILIQLIAAAEYDQRDFAIAQHWQLVSLFHHTEFAFVEGHLENRLKRKTVNNCVRNNELIEMLIANERRRLRTDTTYCIMYLLWIHCLQSNYCMWAKMPVHWRCGIIRIACTWKCETLLNRCDETENRATFFCRALKFFLHLNRKGCSQQ